MKPQFILIAAILIGTSFTTASAQIKHRSQVQKHRIKQGVNHGELTRAEAANLAHDRNEIRKDIRLAKSDGKVTSGERRIIKKEVNHESREIHRKKHNNRDRN